MGDLISVHIKQKIGFSLFFFCSLLVAFFLFLILFDIVSKGHQVMSFSFITEAPREGMTAGGVMPAALGTVFVTLITTLFAMPLGICAAIYLSEYAKSGPAVRIIRASIRNLAGVPSIVYGLFGVALFVEAMAFGRSILSAGLTLGILNLPWIITTSEEALQTVPQSYRDGSLALGATKWETIYKNVLPYALPGILTGVVLSISRAAGETAPILFTGAAYSLPFLPESVFDQFMALPYHLYILSTQHESPEIVQPIAYGTALLLVSLVFLLNLTAIITRYRLRKKKIR